MKSLYLFLLVFCLNAPLFGQETDPPVPKWVLGGSVQFSFQNNSFPGSPGLLFFTTPTIVGTSTTPARNTSFGASPYLGRQLNDRALVGLRLEYQGRYYKAEDVVLSTIIDTIDFTRVNHQGGLGLFMRWTFNPQNKVQVFIEPSLGYTAQVAELANDGVPFSREITQFGSLNASLGASYLLSQRWRLLIRSGSASLLVGQWHLDNSTERNNFTLFNTNLSLSSIRFGAELLF